MNLPEPIRLRTLRIYFERNIKKKRKRKKFPYYFNITKNVANQKT